LANAWLKERLGLREKRPAYWEFQRKWIGTLGLRIEPSLLARALAKTAIKQAGSPYEIFEKLARKRRK
jgi:hypothetical protein